MRCRRRRSSCRRRAGPAGRPRPVGPGEEEEPARVVRVDEIGGPIEVDRAGQVARQVRGPARAVGSPADVEHPDLRSTEVVGEPVRRGQQLRASETAHAPEAEPADRSMRSGREAIVAIIRSRGLPLHARRGEDRRGPRGAAGDRGGHLPERRIGRSDAGRDRPGDGRDRRARADDRSRGLTRRTRRARPDGRGQAAVAASSPPTSTRGPDPLDDRRAQHGSRGHDWQPGDRRDDEPEHVGCYAPLLASARRAARGRARRRRRWWGRGGDPGRLGASPVAAWSRAPRVADWRCRRRSLRRRPARAQGAFVL